MKIVEEIDRMLVARGEYSTKRLRWDLLEVLDFFGDAWSERAQISPHTTSTALLKKRFLTRVRELEGRRPIGFNYDPDKTSWQILNNLLRAARLREKESTVIFHLTGAILAIRFPEQVIRNKSFGSASAQAGEAGDFQVGDTIFHIAVAAMSGLLEKCKRNLTDGFRVYVVVPDRIAIGTRQNAEQTVSGRIQVVSLEDFISQNIEEIAEFSSNRLREGFRHLFEKYNERVNAVEKDKSLLLEIPENLRPRRR